MSDLLVLCEGPATMSSEFSHQCLRECVNFLHHFNLLCCTSFLIPNLYLIGLMQSTSFSFSVMVSSLIEDNSGKDFGSTLEAFAVMDMLA